MVEVAEVVKNAMIPSRISQMPSGCIYLYFDYFADDKVPPYKWPKVIKYQGNFFGWSCYNSDHYYVVYRQMAESEIATVVKK